MRKIFFALLLQMTLIIAPVIVSSQSTNNEVVNLIIRVFGLPPNLSSSVYLNGTSVWVDGALLIANSSKPFTVTLKRGSIITVALDLQVYDNLGNVYTLSHIEYNGTRYGNVMTIKMDQDVKLTVYYDWSHVLFNPMLLPLYILLLLLVLYKWLKSLSKRRMKT